MHEDVSQHDGMPGEWQFAPAEVDESPECRLEAFGERFGEPCKHGIHHEGVGILATVCGTCLAELNAEATRASRERRVTQQDGMPGKTYPMPQHLACVDCPDGLMCCQNEPKNCPRTGKSCDICNDNGRAACAEPRTRTVKRDEDISRYCVECERLARERHALQDEVNRLEAELQEARNG